MVDFFPVHRKSIINGDFPLNHDAILRVEFYYLTKLRYQYFTCKSQDTGTLADILCKLYTVHRVCVVSVDEFPNDF